MKRTRSARIVQKDVTPGTKKKVVKVKPKDVTPGTKVKRKVTKTVTKKNKK